MKILYLGNIKNEFFFSFLSKYGDVLFHNKEFKFKEYKIYDSTNNSINKARL